MPYDPSKKLERPVLEAVVAFLEKRYGESLPHQQWVDCVVRETQAVDLAADGAARKFAIEHTRLNSFNNQIRDDAQLLERLWGLLPELDGTVPGLFHLTIDAGAINSLSRRRTPAAWEKIVDWIRREAPDLQAERDIDADDLADGGCEIAATLPGVPFELRLRRIRSDGSEVILARRVPDDHEQQEAEDVARALEEKNPKLAVESANGRTRLLVLEIRDFQLQSMPAVARAVREAGQSRSDMPELIYLVDTSLGGMDLYVLKEDEVYSTSRKDDIGPFAIGLTASSGTA